MRAYDASGNVTTSANRSVTVANKTGSKYSATFELNEPGTDDDQFPPWMIANTSPTAPVVDPYDPSGGGGYGGRRLSSGPIDATPMALGPTGAAAVGPTTIVTPPVDCTPDAYCPTVTVTNTSTVAWKGGDLRVWYRWYSPNGVILYEGPANPADNFPNTVQPQQSKSVPLVIKPPAMPLGASLGDYRLRFDIYDTDESATTPSPRWFSEKGNQPVDNPVIVAKDLRAALGLEKYYQYEGEAVGAGMQAMTNIANGNNLLRWTPWTSPGRGLTSVFDITYNSLEDHSDSPLGHNFSLGLSGLTRFGIGLDIHPNKADEISGNANRWVRFIDSDGTPHTFQGTLNANGTVTWTPPAGVFLYLRHYSDTDPNRAWALSRPDKVTFFFTEDGFPTRIEDRNGNAMVYTLQAVQPGDDPGGPKQRVVKMTDPGGRDVDITYWTKADAPKAQVRGKVKQITDHADRALDFAYYDDGNLLRITQRGGTTASGDFLADRSFVFTYTNSAGTDAAITDPALRQDPDPHTPNQSTRLYSVADPRTTETRFAYYGPSEGSQLRWRLKTRTNRVGSNTSFAYDTTGRITTVTAPPVGTQTRATRYYYDTVGRPTKIINPKNESTTLLWTPGNQVDTITEPNLATRKYTYNANGYLTSVTNQESERTDLGYLNRPLDSTDTGTHWSLLATRTSPEGTATATAGDYQWDFSYDTAGNMTTVVQPGPENYTSRLCYNLAVAPACNTANEAGSPGTLRSLTDPDGRVITYASYDANGLATAVTNGRGDTTRLNYDADGLLQWVQDAEHATDSGSDVRSYRSYFDYDSFRRLGRQSSPKSTAHHRGLLVWTTASYDPNDNVTAQTQPTFGFGNPGGGATMQVSYNLMDRTSLVTNPDTSADPAGERTKYDYDAAGRLSTVTLPIGMLTGVAKDHQVLNSFDSLDRISAQTRNQVSSTGVVQETRTSYRCYDNVGNLTASVAPNANLGAPPTCPATGALTGVANTTTYTYDKAHRIRTTTDPLGHVKQMTYTKDGRVKTETDAAGRVTTNTYDQRDLVVKLTDSMVSDAQGNITRPIVSVYGYDGAANRTRLVSPRGYDASADKVTFTDYVTSYDYDAAGQVSRVTLPKDATTPVAYVHYYYDKNGRPSATSLPVSEPNGTSVSAGAKTAYTYFDPGWVRTSDDPANPAVHYDYTAQGQQAERVPENASGGLDRSLTMSWSYYVDGKLSARADQTGQPARYFYDADNNATRALSVQGVGDPGQSQLETLVAYDGFDQPSKTRQKRLSDANYTFTTYAYDRDGNVTGRNDDGTETPAGVQVTAPARNTFVYDGADWLKTQFAYGTATTCTGDQRIDNTFTPTGLEETRTVNRAAASCTAEATATYDLKQRTAWTYFDNGKLKTLATTNAAGTTLESHTVGYEDAGVYVNGNRTSDQYVLKGPGSTACSASPCTATYTYDARDKTTRSTDGHGGTTTYTLDGAAGLSDPTIRAGNVTTSVTPTGTTTQTYVGNQLSSVTAGTVTNKYWYDNAGRLDCVTTSAGTAAMCSPSDGGTANAALVADYQYDGLDRLVAHRKYSAGSKTDSATYTYDAFDRVAKETETHPFLGTATRTTTFSYQGLTTLASSEKQTSSANADSTTRAYGYDVYGHRTGVLETKVVGTTTTTARSTFGNDVHGSVSLLVNEATGSASASYGYTPYGDLDSTLSKGDTSKVNPTNPYRFSAKRWDSGSQTVDMGARRFGPDIGRFLQRDVLQGALGDLGLGSDPLTQNRYALAAGNPLSFVETDGHMLIADGGGGGSRTPTTSRSSGTSTGTAPGGQASPDDPVRSGDWCAEHLSCSIGTFNKMSISERKEFVTEFQERWGEQYDSGEKFHNVEGVLDVFADTGEGKTNSWTSWVDSTILHGFERGMAITVGKPGGNQGNPGADKWASYFRYARANPGDSDESRRRWSEAEQASTEHGYQVARDHGTAPSVPTGLFAVGGEAYRYGMRHMGTMRTAGRIAGGAACGTVPLSFFQSKCQEIGEHAVQDFLDPSNSAPSYYGGHVIHGYGQYVEGVLTLDPIQAGSGVVETARYGAEGVAEGAGWLWDEITG
ncbi:MAG TPA: RHS repeat-associated core domain-containing protein [Actinoplanes sp.]|nr:RHS repeat-associated core domain-containing protein [Actinoplanes sp.]